MESGGRGQKSEGKMADRWWGRNEKLKMKNEKVGEFESWAGLGGRSWGLGEERGRTGGRRLEEWERCERCERWVSR